MVENRRLHVRRNLFAPGRILHPKAAFECMLHNISAGGALVSVEGAGDIPKHFILQIPGNHEIRRRCVLVWRDGDWVGMKFAEPKKKPRTPAAI
jgi:hypothetical protein